MSNLGGDQKVGCAPVGLAPYTHRLRFNRHDTIMCVAPLYWETHV